jgi:pimeloyl-ACP methyl ester carboxylesterase
MDLRNHGAPSGGNRKRRHQSAAANNITLYKLDKGGHFPGWDQPQLFSEEVRAGFRQLRGAQMTTADKR